MAGQRRSLGSWAVALGCCGRLGQARSRAGCRRVCDARAALALLLLAAHRRPHEVLRLLHLRPLRPLLLLAAAAAAAAAKAAEAAGAGPRRRGQIARDVSVHLPCLGAGPCAPRTSSAGRL